jgi:hypothetical protein
MSCKQAVESHLANLPRHQIQYNINWDVLGKVKNMAPTIIIWHVLSE